MNKIVAFLLILSLACTPEKEEPIDVIPPLILPDDFSYKGQNPKLGTSDMLYPVIELNKRFSQMNADLSDLLADSITAYMEDGSVVNTSREEMVASLTEYLSTYDSMHVTINAAIPIVYDNLDHQWVYSWVFEEYYSNGEKSSRYLHEDFRLENGKIRDVSIQAGIRELTPSAINLSPQKTLKVLVTDGD